MQYLVSSADLQFTSNNEGEVEFRHEGILYRSVGQATFNNSPNDNFSTYGAPLVCPEDEEYPDSIVGQVRWTIINEECEDESEACNWDEFDIYV